MVPFGEWLPDLPEYNNPGALLAKNVIPQLDSYRGLNSLSSFTNALTGVCLGVFWAQDNNNSVYDFAGDNTKLYRLTAGDTWSDASRTVGGAYSATNWEFTKFGDRIIAANKADDLQYFELGVSSNFAALPGSPPKAKTIATVRDFIMLGDLDTLGGNFIQWSGYNSSELWTPSIKTQSDFQELFGRGGRVQRIIPGSYGTIFAEHSIFTAEYVGPPVIFQINEVERKRGTPAPNSTAWTGGKVFYFGWDGFYVFDGQRSTPISHNKVSNWFALNCPAAVFDDIRAAVDRINRLVMWAFKTSTSEPINNRLLIYNWAVDRWSYAEVDTQIIDEFVSPGFSLDDLDTLFADIDSESIPVDTDAYKGGTINLQAFNSSNQAATFSGTPLAATIDTKEISGPDNKRLMTNSVRPLIEASGASTVTVQVGKRNRLQDNVTYTAPKALNGINGEASIRENSRYQRYRINIASGFLHGDGVKANGRLSGGRR
jgi:hypothetical protein